MNTESKSCLDPWMLPCEQYLEGIHLYCYQGSPYNPLSKDYALHQLVLMAGWVLLSESIPDLKTASILHHRQTGTTGLKIYNTGIG